MRSLPVALGPKSDIEKMTIEIQQNKMVISDMTNTIWCSFKFEDSFFFRHNITVVQCELDEGNSGYVLPTRNGSGFIILLDRKYNFHDTLRHELWHVFIASDPCMLYNHAIDEEQIVTRLSNTNLSKLAIEMDMIMHHFATGKFQRINEVFKPVNNY